MPRGGEDSHAFVVRVEAERRTVGANKEATLHCFLPKLSAATRDHLERVRSTKAMLGLSGTELTWDEVVAMARDAMVHGQKADLAAPPPPPAPVPQP